MTNIPGLIYAKGKALLRFLALDRRALLDRIDSLVDRAEQESIRAVRAEEERDRCAGQLRALQRGRAFRARRDSMRRGRACGASAIRRHSVLYRFKLGQILVGGVTEITAYGIYVEIEEVTWLVRVPACWRGEFDHPSEVVTVGRQVQVRLIGTQPCSIHPFLVLV